MKKKVTMILAFALVAVPGMAQKKLMNKLISKVANVVGSGTTASTADLTQVDPIVGISTNLYPDEVGTVSQSFFNGWKPGGEMVSLVFTPKANAGISKIDGTVTIDGKPAEYAAIGVYYAFSESAGAPHKVELSTSSGQTASFTIAPNAQSFKLISVNGQKGKASLDLNRDVVIELENAPPDQFLKVSLAINQLSIKSIYDVGYFRSGSTVTIPAAAFRNINITPGGDAIYNYKNSYISISSEENSKAAQLQGSYSELAYTSVFTDGMFVEVTKEPALNKGLTVEGKENFDDGSMEYTAYKPNAFMSRPFSEAKKIGVSSFGIRGTTYVQKTTESQFYIKTVTLTFPQLSNEVWDAVLAKLYPDFMAILEEELNASVLDIGAVTSTPAYQSVQPSAKDDENTTVQFSRSYRNTKLLSAFMPPSEGYGVNGLHNRLMKEAGADALLNMTLDLQLEQDKEFAVMVPKLAFDLLGATNGNSASTKFCTGTIAGKGVRSTENITAEELDRIIRRSDLMVVFRKAIKELKEKEAANTDYQLLWSMR